jgi:hypothetical protein
MSVKLSDHIPLKNFLGCAANWGPYIDLGPGGGLHICDRPTAHRGKHRCKCGDTPDQQEES